MTEFVTCRVCDCQAPLGTVECPDCGAPLPTEAEVPAQPIPDGVESPSPDGDTPVSHTSGKKKRRLISVVAGLLVLCLLLPMVVWLARPKKEPLPGVMIAADGLVTPDGVWDYTAGGFYQMDSTSDGRYVLLREKGEDATDSMPDGVVWSWGGASTSLNMGDYCLFDGRTLERTDWETVHLIDNGTVFYTQKDDAGTTLFRRDLNRGKTVKIDRFVGEGYLDHFVYAMDGSAAVYRWRSDGAEEPEEYRLWRKGSKQPISLDITGEIYGVAEGGMTCLFWKDRFSRSSYLNGRYSSVWTPSYSLWQDGEVTDLPTDMQVAWFNTTYTQFILEETREDHSRGWYYYAPEETDQPVLLDAPGESYLVPAGRWIAIESVKDRFYSRYDSGGDKLCYLTDDLTLLTVEGDVGDITLSEDSKTALYIKNGDLYQARMDENGTLEVVALTNTARRDPVSSLFVKWGVVTQFAASKDLTHIYYAARKDLYAKEMTLHHWHDGKDRTLDFEISDFYNAFDIRVTNNGECYFIFNRNAYYTEGDRPPELLVENVGSTAGIWLVGEVKWPLVMGTRWQDGKRVYWRLDSNNIPVELEEWYPEEGTV